MRENSDSNAQSQGNGASVDEIIAAAAESRRKLSADGYPPGARKERPATFDFWTALDILAQKWHWLVLGGILAAGGFFYLGSHFIKPKYTATAKLLRFETPGERDFFTEVMSSETFSALIRSPDLLRKVGEFAEPSITPEKFVKFTKIEPEPDSDIVRIVLAGREPNWSVSMVNHYASNAVDYARQFFAQRAQVVATEYLRKELESMDQDIRVLDDQFRNLHLPPELSLKLSQVGGAVNAMSNNLAGSSASVSIINSQRERLDLAIRELNDLLAIYTPKNPRVQAKQGQVKDLETELNTYVANAPTNVSWAAASSAPRGTRRVGASDFNPETDIIRMKLMALEQGRVNLAERYRQAERYAETPPGVVRLYAPATLQGIETNKRQLKIGLVSVFGGFLGMFAMLALVALVELVDGRLKTADDVKRVTRLQVLTSLGNLRQMTAEDRSQWAFRTWTMLQGRLSPSANHGLVCGITSSEAGEGRTTWIRLLAEAASMTGFRVLTIATKPSPTHMQLTEGSPAAKKAAPPKPANGKPAASSGNGHSEANTTALTTSVLSAPDQVTEQLTGPNSQPMVHIPLPGWVWNLERRRQWGAALHQWKQIDNLVILVELPPGSVPEAVLLGSNLPNLLWLTNSGTAKAGKTRSQIETLRHARCNIVGAVLNRESATPMRKRFPRWLGAVTLLASFALASAQAQITLAPANTSAAPTPTEQLAREPGFSITKPSQRAAWQQKLTLGPGDILNFGLFGSPELTHADVAVGPDGRISFLEAHDIVATGLTVDELRTRMDQAIGEYRRAARTIITPVAFRSKKYYVLGKVMTKGVYTLDRPLTVVEAIARAHGLENGLVDRNVIDLADFQRSFLMRDGKRIPLNFEKLFTEGDLSQNIAIEPGDYLYFASADIREVYIVGEVRLPGPATYNPDMTILSAITTRGGFTERAFKSRVLVIRGPLDAPERIIVDTTDIITGRSLNFRLQPRDIVFVNSRPFIRVEELADLAATAFLQSLITGWVGVDVVKPIN